MPDQLTGRARRAAEEIVRNKWDCPRPDQSCNPDCEFRGECRDGVEVYSDIIERHMREWLEEKNLYAEKSRQFNESEIRRFEENHKEAAPCQKK